MAVEENLLLEEPGDDLASIRDTANKEDLVIVHD
jgi:hypothetical protein